MKKRNLLSKILVLMLVLSIGIFSCGCGKLNDYQQQFVDAVGIAETATNENSLNMIKDAFSKYSTLTEKDAQNEKVVEAKTKLVSLFDSKVETLSKEEMSVSLDAKISEFEAVVNDLPAELQNGIPGCEKLKTIRADHLKWYVDQKNNLAEKINKINEQFEALNLEETVTLINETIPLLKDLEMLSYEKNIEDLNKEYGISSSAEGIETLENVKKLIVKMCYKDCYVVRFEYITKHTTQSNNYRTGKDYFMYFYDGRVTTITKLSDYLGYLRAHFKLVSSNLKDLEYEFEVGKDMPTLKVSEYTIESYGIFAVMVCAPYMAPEEQGLNN